MTTLSVKSKLKAESHSSSSRSTQVKAPEGKEEKVLIPYSVTPLCLQRGRGETSTMSLPPTLQVTPRISYTIPYRITSAISGGSVTWASLAGALGVIATSSSSASTLCSSLFVRKVTVWLPSTTSSECILDWVSALTAFVPDESRVSAIPDGISVTRALVFTPPRKSLASLWMNSALATTPIFSISAPEGSVLHLSMQARLCNVEGPTTVSVSGATAGKMYYLPLDTGSVIVPLGLPTVAL